MTRLILILSILLCACVAELSPRTSTKQSDICEYDGDTGQWYGDCGGGPGGGGGGSGDPWPPVCYSYRGQCDAQGGWISDLNCALFCGYDYAHCYPSEFCDEWPNCSQTHDGFCQ